MALRGGGLRRRIPRSWTEEYPDESRALFRDPGRPTRVLRVSSVAVPLHAEGLEATLETQARAQPTTLQPLPGGGCLLKSLDPDAPGRVAYRWLLGVQLGSDRARVVTCALTVPEAVALDPLTRDDLALLEWEIRNADLAS